MADLAVIILTHEEEIHIARAIAAVAPVAKEIFVIDSHSRDRTAAIAESLGAKVIAHAFVNHARQFQWALENAPITAEWILRLDADEVVSPELAREIEQRLPCLGREIVGVRLNRRQVFLGRWVRHGGRYPLLLLRIFRRGHGRIENRWMDEHMIVDGGATVTFAQDFADVNLKGLSFFTAKHNSYASREAVDVLNRKHRLGAAANVLSRQASGGQAAAKRFLKEQVYNKLPFWLGPCAYFVYRMTFQLGFLDGREGLAYHFLQGFWYRLLVGAKLLELERGLEGLTGAGAKVAALERMTGLKISESESALPSHARP